MKMQPERRAWGAIEFRAAGEDSPPRIRGHAAVFNELSEDLGGFREKIAPGAFSRTLGADVRALINHDPNLVLGRSTAKTLRMSEDADGLAVEIDLPDTAPARDLAASMERGDVNQMSFGFRTIEDKWDEVDGRIERTLLRVDLFDVSVVTFPAYPQTDAAMRSLEAWKADAAPPDLTLHRARLRLAGA